MQNLGKCLYPLQTLYTFLVYLNENNSFNGIFQNILQNFATRKSKRQLNKTVNVFSLIFAGFYYSYSDISVNEL